MSKPHVSLVGQTFNKLTLLEYFPGKRNGSKKVHGKYRCVCACGTEVIAGIADLKKGSTKSCGCLSAEMTTDRRRNKTPQEATITQIFNNYRMRAHKSKYVFELSRAKFEALIFVDCTYCGQTPATTANYWVNRKGELIQPRSLRFAQKRTAASILWTQSAEIRRNGIDRADNTIGYTDENCVPCCKHCNFAKNDLTQAEFIDLAHRIAARHPKPEVKV